MNCVEYLELTPRERADYLGELIHSCQSDSKFFSLGEKIIRSAKRKGLFKDTIIQPEDWSHTPANDWIPPTEEINISFEDIGKQTFEPNNIEF